MTITTLLMGLLLNAPQTAPQTAPVPDPPPTLETPPVMEPPPAAPAPRGPRFFAMSHLSEWSYLEGPPDSVVPDLFDPLKNIDLGGDWRLDLGGNLQIRMMSETNKLYGGRRPTQDTYLLQQYRLHFNLRYSDTFRFFVEGIHAAVDERQTPALGIDENHNDIHQAFVDLSFGGPGARFTLRVGRQELLYGAHRLVSPLMWANTRRTFDGATLKMALGDWQVDGFYVRPVPIDRSEGLHRKWDEYDEDQHFFGVYSTYAGWERHGLDVYYLVLLDHRPPPNSAGFADNMTTHTIGSRWWGKTGPWDYEAEGAIQLGHHGGDHLFAWMIALEGGYTFETVPMTPRIALGFNWATGDHDPTDDRHNTFNQLFPLGHAYLGWLDQIGRQNIISPELAVHFKPCKPVKVSVAYHYFWLDQNDDALYNAGGGAVRRDPTGGSGSSVGGEMDVRVAWQIDVHQSLELGYAHFWPGSFIKRTGDDDSPDFVYLQYVLNF